MTDRNWIDVSLPIRSGMLHWPSDPPVSIGRVQDMEKGEPANLSRINMGVHSGTHVDAPIHFLPRGKGVDALSLDALIGMARVIEVHADAAVNSPNLEPHKIRRGDRILLKTRNSAMRLLRRKTFSENFVHLGADGAEYLVTRGVRTIGIDYLSIGGYKKDGRAVHRRLLGAGILIIESLDLSDVPPGRYEMICLPIRILNGDGAPARILLRPARPRTGKAG